MRLLWQTADGFGNDDMSSFVTGLHSTPDSIMEIVDQARQDANSHNSGVGMVIDGQFNDWDSVGRESDDFDAANPHVDLREYAVAAQADETFFYLQVDGEVLNGIAVPAAEARSIPSHGADSSNVPPASGSGSQQSTPLPVDSSQDAVRVLIDTDNDASTGYRQFGLALGADRMVEITGHYGIITQRAEMVYTGSGGSWEWGAGSIIDAAASGGELELSLALQDDFDYYLHLTGWNDVEDMTSGHGIDFDNSPPEQPLHDRIDPVQRLSVVTRRTP